MDNFTASLERPTKPDSNTVLVLPPMRTHLLLTATPTYLNSHILCNVPRFPIMTLSSRNGKDCRGTFIHRATDPPLVCQTKVIFSVYISNRCFASFTGASVARSLFSVFEALLLTAVDLDFQNSINLAKWSKVGHLKSIMHPVPTGARLRWIPLCMFDLRPKRKPLQHPNAFSGA